MKTKGFGKSFKIMNSIGRLKFSLYMKIYIPHKKFYQQFSIFSVFSVFLQKEMFKKIKKSIWEN